MEEEGDPELMVLATMENERERAQEHIFVYFLTVLSWKKGYL